MNKSLLSIALASLGTVVLAQSDPYVRAAEIMGKLDLSSEWRPQEMIRTDTGAGRRLASPQLILTFYGPSNKLLAMHWLQRLDEIRARRDFVGGHFSTHDAVRQRAQTIMANLGLADGWNPEKILDRASTTVGATPEFAGGAISVRFAFFVNGLRDTAKGAEIMFDSLDGKVVSVSIMNPGANYTYLPLNNLISADAAEARARTHDSRWLRENTPADYAEELIARFPAPGEVQPRLSYGTMDAGFNSRSENYRGTGIRYPIYFVNFGDLVGLHILATTGECVGGGVYKTAAEIPRTPGSKRIDVEPAVPVSATGPTTEKPQLDDSGTQPDAQGQPPEVTVPVPLVLVIGGAASLLGAGVALFLNRGRSAA